MATPELPDDLPSATSQSSQQDVEVVHSQRLASPAVARNRDVIPPHSRGC